MAETEVRTDGIDQLIKSWDDLLKEYPAMKERMMVSLSKKMLGDVLSGLNSKGDVRKWQIPHVGSRLGYVAVRPAKNTYQVTKGGNRYAVGYVTNAIENGHRNRKPQPTGKDNYHYTKGRHKSAATPGKHFYARARQGLDSDGEQAVRELAEKVARRMEGKT